MRFLKTAVLGLLGLVSQQSLASPTPVDKRQTQTVSDLTIFSPPSNAGWVDPRVLYARSIQISGGALLATWENYSPEGPKVYFPIYRSTDFGRTWAEIGRVQDTVNNWGLRYQPMLYELPQAIGNYPAGTVLLVGNSIPTDLSKTKLDVYASRDKGATWTFTSSVAAGGEARPNNGLTPVWEPFLFVHNNQLVCYYADQRDTKFGQKLSHQVTSDLVSWGGVVNDVADTTNYESRPGMPTIAKLPNGQFIFAYEICGGSGGCRVFYRLTSDPLNVNGAGPDIALVSDKGTRPVSSPFVVWTSIGGANGTIVMSGGSPSQIFVNRQLGAANAWVEYNVPQPNAYSRGLMVFQSNPAWLAIIGGGWLPPSSVNRVSISVLNLAQLIGV